jgi:branched-subunit amino acid transport protein
MSGWYIALAIAGITFGTLLARSGFYAIGTSTKLPPTVDRALRYAPACALAAIIAPSVLAPGQAGFSVAVHNHHLWAVAAATVVFVVRRNMILMMTVGMAVFTGLRLLLG